MDDRLLRPAPFAITAPKPWMPTWSAYAVVAAMWVVTAYNATLAWRQNDLWFLTVNVGVTLLMVLWWAWDRYAPSVRDSIGLFPTWPAADPCECRSWTRQWWLVAVLALLAFLIAPVSSTLAQLGSPTFLGAPSVIEFLWRAPFVITSAVALVVVLLRAAGRSTWELHAVTLAAVIPLLWVPFGLWALAVVPATMLLVELYRITRRLTPVLLAEAFVLAISWGLADLPW